MIVNHLQKHKHKELDNEWRDKKEANNTDTPKHTHIIFKKKNMEETLKLDINVVEYVDLLQKKAL